MIRAGLIAGVLAIAVTVSQAAAGTSSGAAVTITGRGFGHGIGLSQWGAEARAAAGQPAAEILAFYYPHTRIERVPSTDIRVLLGVWARATIGSAAPAVLVEANGAERTLPAGRHTVTATALDGAPLQLPAIVQPTTLPLTQGGTRYEGSLELSADGDRVRVVNSLPLERYVGAVVSSECPGTWAPAALEAQAIASRSYALANRKPNQPFDVYPDDRSQNYHGLLKHLPAALAATAATEGLALVYQGAVVPALFSASNGGRTSVADGIWSSDRSPYFVAETDRFDRANPGSAWGPVQVTRAQLQAAFPKLPWPVDSVQVTRNAGDRATAVRFTGADGATLTIGGYAFQQRLGLRSTFFSITAP